MNTQTLKTFTPEQVAEILQLNKNTVYDLIKKGEIIAKKIGKSYRVPITSIAFTISGLDYDLLKAQQEDLKNIAIVEEELKRARKLL